MSPTTSSRSSAALVDARPRRPDHLVLRADGGDGVGSGHVGRCLALAEAWERAGGYALLVLTPAAARAAEALGCTVAVSVLDVPPGSPADADRTDALADGAWLVVDGYRFSGLPRSGPVLVLDDFGHGAGGDATVLLDQNLRAAADHYAGRHVGRLLLGPSYALLRAMPVVPADRSAPPVRAVVAVGGEPSALVLGHVRVVIEALVADGVGVDVIGGAGPVDLPDLEGLVVHGFVADPAPLLARADVAVAAAGSTVYSLCRHGVPSVVIAFHANQAPIARAFAAASVALTPAVPDDPDESVALVRRLLGDPGLRTRLGAAGAALVDGRGADRVVAALREA